MKSNPDKYIKAVLVRLGLLSEQVGISDEMVLKAAKWASGMPNFSFENSQLVALCPVLGTLKGIKSSYWHSPTNLTLTPDFFPNSEQPSPESLRNQVFEIKKALEKVDANLLTSLHFHASTLAVSKDISDLPLFDFIKTTAAIAHCLENGNGKLRLVGGSISGIQSYLYDIVSKRAGKLLKGRSFYLQLLSDSLAERLLEWFELSDAHIVYSSGGGFYVLIPDNENVLDRFEDFKSEVIKQLYKQHRINLSCEFAVSEAFDEETSIPEIWDDLFKELNEAKKQRLSHNSGLLEDLLGFVDEGGADGDENSQYTRDTVTNDQILRSEAVEFDEEGNLVHRFTNAQKSLGEDLRDARFWIRSVSNFADKCFLDPLGYYHLLTEKLPRQLPDGARVQVLNIPSQYGGDFVFYGGNVIPVHKADFAGNDGIVYRKGSPKTFDQLATGERLDRIGILRMDVDNLGQIFSVNIGSPASFARYAAVSRTLDWFFKGYLNTIHAEVCGTSGEKFSERTIIIYSGGDDLFIVGRWLEVLEMACRIQQDFNKWSCGNLTISGGVAILPDKFPVMQGANLAAEKERNAKKYLLNGEKFKNAICFFDYSFNWELEMPLIMSLKEMLGDWLKAGVDNSILKKINQHAESRKDQEKHGDSPRWIWNIAYDFGRFAGRLKMKENEIAGEIRNLAKQATFGDGEFRSNPQKYAVPFLYLLQAAGRWVELEDRTIKKK